MQNNILFVYGDEITGGLFILLFLATVFFAVLVYGNYEKDQSLKSDLKQDMWGGLDVFITDKYLNSQGKKWRKFYLISLFSFLILIMFKM